MHTGVHRFLAFELLVNHPSSGTLAFSLRLASFLPASDSPALHTGSSASPSLAHSHFPGLPPPLFLLTAFSDILASSLRLVPLSPAIESQSVRGRRINQEFRGQKPVNACVYTCTESQTSSTRSCGLGWRIHGSVEDTRFSTNKQHSLSLPQRRRQPLPQCLHPWQWELQKLEEGPR